MSNYGPFSASNPWFWIIGFLGAVVATLVCALVNYGANHQVPFESDVDRPAKQKPSKADRSKDSSFRDVTRNLDAQSIFYLVAIWVVVVLFSYLVYFLIFLFMA